MLSNNLVGKETVLDTVSDKEIQRVQQLEILNHAGQRQPSSISSSVATYVRPRTSQLESGPFV